MKVTNDIPQLKFCGIDQSYTKTGIVILDIDYNSILEDTFSVNGDGIERLNDFYVYFTKLSEEYPNIIFATESYSYLSGMNVEGKKYPRHVQAGELKAVIELAIHRSCAFCISYAPQSHRSKTIKYNGGDKDRIVEIVNILYKRNYSYVDHNIADAYTIARALCQDFNKLADSYGTVLYEKVLSETPFKRYNKKKMKIFEEHYFG
jgi:Holliday junction resolvasome RuvABC endonuclease subunit